MTLFFNPAPDSELGRLGPHGSVTARPARRLRLVRTVTAERSSAHRGVLEWRAAFPAFRAWTVLREAALPALAAGVLLPGSSPAYAGAWALVLGCSLPLLVAATGGYGWRVLGEVGEDRTVLRAGGLLIVILMVLGYLGLLEVPTMVAAGAAPLAVGSVLAGRRLARRSVVRRRARGEALMRTLLVGGAANVGELATQLAKASESGYDVLGWYSTSEGGTPPEGVSSLGPLGGVDRIGELAQKHGADVVMLVGEQEPTAARRALWSLAGTGASLVVVPSVVEIAASRVRVRPTHDLWSLQLEIAPRREMLPGKEVIDRVLGALMLAVAALILVPVMVAVRVTSPGNPLYKQQRVGRDGKLFTMWKVRSMYVDADARRRELLEDSDGNGLLFKMRSDPRVTPIGRLIRRLSIDELPQLYNVVRGEMSIVGPRPPLPEEVMQYSGDEPKRMKVKPGLTGLWQVSGRSDLTREESMRLDLRYVDNWSASLDASILGRTVRAVTRGKGAY